MGLDEIKRAVALYYSPEELVSFLSIDIEELVEALEEKIYNKQKDLLEDMEYPTLEEDNEDI